LIEPGTIAAIEATLAELVEPAELEPLDELVVLEDELLPHPTMAAAVTSEVASESQLLRVRMHSLS
jgi:hypothetical protein